MTVVMDIQEVLQYLPHRYPFLLVDRVIELEPFKRIRAIKNVTMNEPFFTGHFPDMPVMPGVLIVEAMAQTGALLSFKSDGKPPGEDSVLYFAGIDNVRFKRPVVPGDQLVFDIECLRAVRNSIFKYKGVALVGDEIAVEAEFMCVVKKTT